MGNSLCFVLRATAAFWPVSVCCVVGVRRVRRRRSWFSVRRRRQPPGSTFIVNGAPAPKDSALTSVGAEFYLRSNWSLETKFDGEFASHAQTYTGKAVLRHAW